MEEPEQILGVLALICTVASLPFLLFPRLSEWYVENTIKGQVWAKALGRERTIRLIRFAIAPIMLLAGVGAGVFAFTLWR